MTEHDKLDRALADASWTTWQRCGDDYVSLDAEKAYMEPINALLVLCRKHVSELRDAGDALHRAELDYGYTEAEIAEINASFTSK